jgi:hypothetical protein
VKPDRYAGLRVGQAGLDVAAAEVVLVTNCICSLPHRTAEEYEESHGDGCLMVPYEGLVVQTTGPAPDGLWAVISWRMEDIRHRQLTLLPDEAAANIRRQMAELLVRDRAAYRHRMRRRTA